MSRFYFHVSELVLEHLFGCVSSCWPLVFWHYRFAGWLLLYIQIYWDDIHPSDAVALKFVCVYNMEIHSVRSDTGGHPSSGWCSELLNWVMQTLVTSLVLFTSDLRNTKSWAAKDTSNLWWMNGPGWQRWVQMWPQTVYVLSNFNYMC